MCILLGFELLLVLEQNFFYSCTFTFFTWSHSGEAPVNMALRGEWVQLTQRKVSGDTEKWTVIWGHGCSTNPLGGCQFVF